MGVAKKLLRDLDARDGHRCAWSGNESDTLVPHHRSNRGMGGHKAGDRIANLVWLDSTINGLIESDAGWAAIAHMRGIKISRYDNPASIVVEHGVHGRVFLLDDGTVQ